MTEIQKVIHKAEVVYKEARQLALAGNYAEAIAVFDHAIDLHKGYAKAYFERGVCYYKLGQYVRATDDIDAASVLGFETAQFWSRHQRTTHRDPHIDESK